MALEEKARKSLEEHLYTFTLYPANDQRKILTAWKLGYVEGMDDVIKELNMPEAGKIMARIKWGKNEK